MKTKDEERGCVIGPGDGRRPLGALVFLFCAVLMVPSVLVYHLIAPELVPSMDLRGDFSLGDLEGLEQMDPLEKGAVLGAHWFGRVQKEDGSLIYIYDPDNSTEVKGQPYSLARHSASMYPLVMAYERTGDERYLETAIRAAHFTSKRMVRDGDLRMVVSGGRSSMFDNALALIGFCYIHQATGDPEILDEVKGLAALVAGSIDGSGRVDSVYIPGEGHGKLQESLMASGEALLGLALAYKRTGDIDYREALVRGVEYHCSLLTSNGCSGMSTEYYSWMASAFSEAFALTGNPNYKDSAYRISEWIVDNHYESYFRTGAGNITQRKALSPELVGSFRTFPSMNTCTYCEGLGDVLLMALAAGDLEQVERFGSVIQNASSFILNLQYGLEEAQGFDRPELVTGGVRHDLFDRVNEDMGWQSRWIRIDYTQHALGALFRYLRFLDEVEVLT